MEESQEPQLHQQQVQVVRPLRIGVLALQGAFLEHINQLTRLENPPQTVEVALPSCLLLLLLLLWTLLSSDLDPLILLSGVLLGTLEALLRYFDSGSCWILN